MSLLVQNPTFPLLIQNGTVTIDFPPTELIPLLQKCVKQQRIEILRAQQLEICMWVSTMLCIMFFIAAWRSQVANSPQWVYWGSGCLFTAATIFTSCSELVRSSEKITHLNQMKQLLILSLIASHNA
jgi:hypothetical protein